MESPEAPNDDKADPHATVDGTATKLKTRSLNGRRDTEITARCSHSSQGSTEAEQLADLVRCAEVQTQMEEETLCPRLHPAMCPCSPEPETCEHFMAAWSYAIMRLVREKKGTRCTPDRLMMLTTSEGILVPASPQDMTVLTYRPRTAPAGRSGSTTRRSSTSWESVEEEILPPIVFTPVRKLLKRLFEVHLYHCLTHTELIALIRQMLVRATIERSSCTGIPTSKWFTERLEIYRQAATPRRSIPPVVNTCNEKTEQPKTMKLRDYLLLTADQGDASAKDEVEKEEPVRSCPLDAEVIKPESDHGSFSK